MHQGFIVSHLHRQNANIWLNDTSLKSIHQEGKVTSLKVFPGVENKLSLQYEGSVKAWYLRVTPGKDLLFYVFHIPPIKFSSYEMKPVPFRFNIH